MFTFVLDYAKVSPIIIIDTIDQYFSGRLFACWVDFNSDTFGIRITAFKRGDFSPEDIKWINQYLEPFLWKN